MSKSRRLREAAIFYVVDSENRVVEVGEGWDDGAQEAGGGPRSRRENIIGQKLDSFLVGDATKMFVRAVLETARFLNEPRALPYRCDSPAEHRRFEMRVIPLPLGHVRVEHRIIEASSRTPPSDGPPRSARAARGAQRLGWRCSQCLRVRLVGGDMWLETELEPQAMTAVDVCPDCAKSIFDHPSTAQDHGS